MQEVVTATGHEHVSASHASTFEVTTDDWLTPAGDCIVAIEADRAPADFADDFVAACQDADATIAATLEVADSVEDLATAVEGRGHPDLTFESDRSLVARTSDYVDDRTVMVEAEGAAQDLNRDVVRALTAGASLRVVLQVE